MESGKINRKILQKRYRKVRESGESDIRKLWTNWEKRNDTSRV